MNVTPVTGGKEGGGGTKGSKETNSNQLVNFSHGVQ